MGAKGGNGGAYVKGICVNGCLETTTTFQIYAECTGTVLSPSNSYFSATIWQANTDATGAPNYRRGWWIYASAGSAAGASSPEYGGVLGAAPWYDNVQYDTTLGLTYLGGSSGDFWASGSGGGGGAGPSGHGANSGNVTSSFTGASGGGGANGGYPSANATANSGTAGGAGKGSQGGGGAGGSSNTDTAGYAATAGSGGGGGGGWSQYGSKVPPADCHGGNGAMDAYTGAYVWDSTHGPGGGGGGGGNNANNSTAANSSGGNGANYGGGGGGSGGTRNAGANRTPGTGGEGLIVITYNTKKRWITLR